MRKHFLILMLLTLLPLAGWADGDIDLTNATVSATLGSNELTYLGTTTTPAIQKITVNGTDIIGADVEDKFIITYYKGAVSQGTIGVKNVGNYTFKITGKDGSGYINTSGAIGGADFTINKVDLTINVKQATKAYGDADPTELQYDVVSGYVGQDSENNVVVNFTTLTRGDGVDVGTYPYTAIVATSTNYNVEIANLGEAEASLKIEKATLTGSYSGDIVKNYGEANPELNPALMTYNGWKMGESNEQKQALLAGATLAYTQDRTDANATSEGQYFEQDGGYALTFTGFNLTNYKVELPANKKMMIKQIPLALTPQQVPDNKYFTYEVENNDLTYSGASQKPDFTVKYKTAQNEIKTLNTGNVTDYIVKYGYAATAEGDPTSYAELTDGTTNITAGYYTVKIVAKEKANYSGELIVPLFKYQIKKKALYVSVADKTKEYDGTAFPITNQVGTPGQQGYAEGATFEYNGLVPADNKAAFISAITGVTASYVETGTHIDVADYKVKANIAAGDNSNLNTNYAPEGLSTGTYSITRRTVTATAKDQSIIFGQDKPAVAATETYVTLDGVATTEISNQQTPIAADVEAILSAITVSYKEDYSAVGSWDDGIQVALKTNAETLCKNYTITPVAGKFSITGATLTLMAKNATIEYGTTYSLTDANLFKYTTTSVAPEGTVEFEIWNEAGSQKLNQLPSAVGQYTIKIVEKDSYKPENYTSINYVPGTLQITQRALTITMDALSLQKGATPAILATYKSKVHVNNLVEGGDAFDFALEFNTANEPGAVTVENGVLTSDASQTPYAKGVKVVAVGAVSENYLVTLPAYFPLTVLAANSLTLDASDPDVFHKIQDANGKEIDQVIIDFNARKNRELPSGTKHYWKADTWNGLVLPFDITVAELSNKLGFAGANAYNYVVVNTINKKSGSGKFQFKLATGLIEANTPIMVKTITDITAAETTTITGKIDFGKKTIVAPANAKAPATMENDYKLVGQYANFEINKTNSWKDDACVLKFMLGDIDTDFANISKTSSATWTIVPFDCYVDLSGDALTAREVIFEFEEADGSTTTIRTISNEENRTVKADGWYTLNGVKLQGAPTQKGIYINNGKKIVIK